MRKHLSVLMLLAALLVPWTSKAQVSCPTGNVVTVSNADTSTTTTSYFPGYAFYNYSFSEVLMLAEDLEGIGTIQALQFKPANTTGGSYFTNCEIYLALTDLTDLSAGYLDDPSAFELVWSGDMSFTTTDWQTIVFDDPFVYDGTSNIVVAVRRNHGVYVSGQTFAAFNAGATLGRYSFQDSGPYTIGSLPTSSTSTSTVGWYKLIGCDDVPSISCHKVRDVYADEITINGAKVHWTDTANSGASYIIINSADNSVVADNITDTFYTITSFTANTVYNIAVMATCGAGDTSSVSRTSFRTACGAIDSLPWSDNFNDYPTGSTTVGSEFIPCFGRYENATSYVYPYVTSTYSYSGQALYYYNYAGSGASYGTKHLLVMPMIDTNTISFDSLQFRFMARSYSSYHGTIQVGVVTDFFNDESFIPLQSFEIAGNDYAEYTVPCPPEVEGACSFAIKYLPRTDGGTTYVIIDNVVVEAQAACAPLVDLAVQGTTTSSALISWNTLPGNPNVPSSFEVTYLNLDDSTATPVTSTVVDNFAAITGLTPSTNYRLWVTPVCGVDLNGVGDSIDFRTVVFGCAQFDPEQTFIDTVGNGTSTSSYFPTYSCYNYAISQQLYTAEELGTAGSLTSISVLPTSVVAANRVTEVYMANVSNTTLTDFIWPSDLTMVYSGTANYVANEWFTFNLSTPFAYSGGTLLVVFRDMTGSYSCSNSFRVHTASGTTSAYVYQDGGAFNIGTTGAYTSNDRNNMIFHFESCIATATCAAPAVMVTGVESDEVSLTWVPGAAETEWDVYYRLEGDTAWTMAASAVSTTNYTVTDLNPGLTYEFRVVTSCSEGDFGATISATTLCAATVSLPVTENMQNREFGVFSRSCWLVGSTYLGSSYPIPQVVSLEGDSENKLCLFYGGGYMVLPHVDEDLDQLQVSFAFTQGGDNVRFLMGLLPEQNTPIDSIIVLDTIIRSQHDTSVSTINYIYKFDTINPAYNGYCLAFWDAFNDNYSFIDNLVLDYAPACTPVSGLAVSNITASSADISWDVAGENATSYYAEYGPAFFTPGTGTQVPAGSSSISLAGLNHSTTYDVYIYSECTALGTVSAPSQVVRFTTPCMPITNFPYVMNFEGVQSPGGTSHILPNCWTRAYSSSYEPYVYYYPNYASSPSYLLYMDDTCVLAMPELGVPIDSLMISFHEYNSYPSDYGLIIGTVDSITPGFGRSFQPIDTIVYTGSGYYFDHQIYLVDYAGNANYLAFKNYNRQGYGYSYHYIDDVVIDRAPTCIAPQNVHVTSLSNVSADLAWNISQAGSYNIEYGPTGFTPGTGSTTTSTTRSVSLTGLTPATTYDVRIVGVCSATDQSDTTVFTFSTMRAAPVTTLPYFCDFADSAIANGWELVNDADNQWSLGSASYAGNTDTMALYISDDGGVSNNYSGVMNVSYAYRSFQLDSGIVYGITFDWKANGEGNYDYLRAFLAPAGLLTAGALPDGGSSTSNFATAPAPAGWIDLGNGKLNLSTSWQTVSLDNLMLANSGTYNLIFMWANDGSVYYQPPATVDNVEFYVNTCPAPTAVYASGSGTTYVDIDWTGGADCTTWQVEYGPAGHTRGTGTIITTSSHPVHITGLESLMAYDFFVRSICSADDTGRWSARTTISTAMCDNATTITSYDPTTNETTSSYSPIGYSFYNYGYVQTIIPADRLTGLEGDITAMAFKPATTDQGDRYTNITVYLANVAEDNLAGGWIAPSDTGYVFTKVIDSADFCYTDTDWQIHSFNTPFTWDGHSSVLVSVRRDHGSYSSGASFVAHTDTVVRMRYAYTDGGSINFDITYGSSGSTPSTGSSTTVGDIHLISCGAGCLAPDNLTADTSSYNSLTFTWADSDTTEVVLVQGLWNGDEGLATQMVYTNNVTFNGLTPSTQYTFAARQVCDGENYSEWSIMTVYTADLPCFAPGTPEVSGVGYEEATITWTAGGIETAWAVRVYNTTFDRTDTVTAMTYTATGLTSGVTYNVTVSSLCGTSYELASEPSDTVNFTTAICTVPTGVDASDITATQATITWTSTGALSYEIEYGDRGFLQGEGTLISNITGTQTVLTGLEPEMMYDVYVRGYCTATLVSAWSDQKSFTTPQDQGIDDVNGSMVNLYPNPASQQVTVSGFEGQATVSVVDMNGREVYTATANGSLTIDVSGMAKGAYFVRITGESSSAIRKLIVK